MLVHRRPRLTTQGAAVSAVALLALGACDDPTARTDLRPEGDPEVLAVLVLNDAFGGLVESATFCKPNDEKRPGLVGLPDFTTTQVCPDTLSEPAAEIDDAAPQGWYVRVMFDELLDPNVEDLIPELDENNQETGVFTGTIAKTKPVILQCENFNGMMVDVDYDGYYSPSGNNVTWPLGPSIVVKPDDPTTLPVNSKCQITLKDSILDKSGNAVPSMQRGPYTFKIAPIQVIATFPGDGETISPEDGGIDAVFNTDLDGPSLCTMGSSPFTDNCVGTAKSMLNADNAGIFPFAFNDYFFFGDLLDSTDYTFELPAGIELMDHCGKSTILPASSAASNTKIDFSTRGISLLSVAPFQGDGVAPSRKIRIDFNQLMEPSSIDATELTLSPTPEGFALRSDFNGDSSIIVLNGQYQLDTEYTMTLKKGSLVRDIFNTKDFMVAEDIVAKFRTAKDIVLTASSPASGATVTKGSPASAVSILLTFNQEMDPTSFVDGTTFTLVNDATGASIPVAAGGVAVNPSNRAQIRFRSTTPASGALAPGKYTFTFKGGQTVHDKITTPAPNNYTQPADRVIKFTVVEATPAPATKCLGAP